MLRSSRIATTGSSLLNRFSSSFFSPSIKKSSHQSNSKRFIMSDGAAATRQKEIIEYWLLGGIEGIDEARCGQMFSKWYGFDSATHTPWPQEKKDALDKEIRDNFEQDVKKLKNGELDDWANSVEGLIAACILGDQFTRNMYRGTGEAFALDEKVLGFVLAGLEKGFEKNLPYVVRGGVLYMPLMHAENVEVSRRMVKLYESEDQSKLREFEKKMLEQNIKFGKDHNAIIEQFGRYPYRNKALGRESTKEELEYLSDESTNTYGQ